MESFDEFRKVVGRLRASDGCPCDKKQSHMSLKPGIAEEEGIFTIDDVVKGVTQKLIRRHR